MKKKKQTIKKRAKDPNKYFSKEEIQMANNHMKKMFNTANYQRNAHQNHNEVYHQSECLSSKCLQTINAGEGVEKREPSYTVDGNVNWEQPLWRTLWRLLKERKQKKKKKN